MNLLPQFFNAMVVIGSLSMVGDRGGRGVLGGCWQGVGRALAGRWQGVRRALPDGGGWGLESDL